MCRGGQEMWEPVPGYWDLHPLKAFDRRPVVDESFFFGGKWCWFFFF